MTPVFWGISGIEFVEIDFECRKVFTVSVVKFIYQFLRGNASFGRINFYRRAMRIGSAHINYIFSDLFKEADVDVRLNVFDKMTYVYVAIGIWQSAGNKNLSQAALPLGPKRIGPNLVTQSKRAVIILSLFQGIRDWGPSPCPP